MNGAVRGLAKREGGSGGAAPSPPPQDRRCDPITEALASAPATSRSLVVLATQHLSRLHEDQSATTAPSTLKVLSALGATFLDRAAALHCYRRANGMSDGGVNIGVHDLSMAFGAWALTESGVRNRALLGAGQAMQESVARDVVLQVIGALCLEQRQDVAQRLCDAFISSAEADKKPVVSDPEAQLPSGVDVVKATHTGPVHARRYTVVLADKSGRREQGRGNSRNSARRAAAAAWMSNHGRSVAVPGQRAAVDPTPPARDQIRGSGHRSGVARLMEIFEVPPAGAALVSQALIHPSWSRDNQVQLQRAGQRDHRALAAAGSRVLAYEYAFLRARSIDPREGVEAQLTTPSREVTGRVVRQLHVTEGLLLGGSQRSVPLSDSTLEDVLQAAVAAAVLSRDVAAPLIASLPHRWSSAFVNSAAAEVDHVTEMDRFCSALQLDPSYTVDGAGPKHAVSYKARLTIKSELLDKAINLDTDESGRSMVSARQAITRRAIAALDQAARDGALDPDATASGKLVGFIRRHLDALRLAASPRGLAVLQQAQDRVAEGQRYCQATGSGGRVQLAPETPAAEAGPGDVAEPLTANDIQVPHPRTETSSEGDAEAVAPALEPRRRDVDASAAAETAPAPVADAIARPVRPPTPRAEERPGDETRLRRTDDASTYQTFLTVNADGDLIERVREQFGDWLRKQKSWDPPTDESGFQRGPEDQELLVLHRSSADGRDFRARLREQHPTTGTWTTNLTVHVDPVGDRAWIGLRVSNSEGRFVQVPRLASFLVDALEARDGDTWLSSAPRLVSVADVESFAEELSSVERQGLYFVAGTGWDDEPIADFQDRVADWTRSTIGLAQVAILDPAATDAFAEIMGTHHRVPAWTVRTFKPEVDPAIEEDGRRHRILGTHRLASEPKLAVRALLTRVARRHTAERPRPRRFVAVDQALTRLEDRLLVEELGGGATAPPVEPTPALRPIDVPPPHEAIEAAENVEAEAAPTDRVSTEVEQYLAQIELAKSVLGVDELSPEALDELARQAAQGRKSTAATDRLTRELEERRQRAESLTDEVAHYRELSDDYEIHLDQATVDLARSADENRWLRTRLRELEDYDTAASTVPESEVTDYPEDFAELADRIEQCAVPNVVFTGNIKTVRELEDHDPLGRIARVAWDALLALSDYVRARASGECDRGIKHYLENTPEGFRRMAPNKFAEGESSATMNAFGEDRVFPIPAGVMAYDHATMAPHFKLGKVGMVTPRLHLLDDWTRSGKVYVGYIGPHLRIAMTN